MHEDNRFPAHLWKGIKITKQGDRKTQFFLPLNLSSFYSFIFHDVGCLLPYFAYLPQPAPSIFRPGVFFSSYAIIGSPGFTPGELRRVCLVNFLPCLTRVTVQGESGWFVVYPAVVDIKSEVHTAAVGRDIRVPIQISHGYGSSGLCVTAAP